MKQVLLDTNFLTAPFQLNVTIFRDFEEKYPGCSFYTLDEALKEAKSIESGKYGDLVEELVDKEDIEVLETEGTGEVDDLLVELSSEFLVATNDKELKSRISDRGRPVMYIRSKSHIVVENEDLM